MARAIHRLTDRACRSAKPGRHSDGGSLYLTVSPFGARSWVFMYTPTGSTRRELGLGAYPAIGLARARELAAELRSAKAEGIDPAQARDQSKAPAMTFGMCVDEVLKSLGPGWVPKHGEQWAYSLNVLAAPLRSLPVDKIDTAKILEVLQPCWLGTPDTAQRLRLRLERVLDWARAHGYREGENPARWRGHLKNLLPQQQRQRTHFAALPYAEVPALVQRLRTWESVSARALAFTILTACRTSEVLGARWDEIDFGAKVWTVPAARMKSRREFRVPLSDQAVDLLRELREGRTADVVFPGWRSRPINVSAMRLVLHELGLRTTVHGFRSSFRIWCAECTTSFPRDVVEMALAHVVGSAVERAYQRGDLLERRRELMQAWGAFCTASDAGNVVTLKRS